MHIGNQTIHFENPPSILECSATVGPKEKEGPLGNQFDKTVDDAFFGEKTWEKAEIKFAQANVDNLMEKANLDLSNMDYIFSGDLMNQCIASSFAFRSSNIPYYGLFNACATFAEGLGIAALFISSGNANNCLVSTSSHFCGAEKQFRFPLELGTQRPDYSQWTVTGCGSTIVTSQNVGPYITYITTGKIVDMGITDTNNMGSAMAAAAADTIYNHFKDTGKDLDYYDLIVTGDLGYRGTDLMNDLLKKNGMDIAHIHTDCGKLIYDSENQKDTLAGGSGAGCSSTVFSSLIYKRLKDLSLNKVLFISTGALMSPISSQQGESIPGIAHAVAIETEVN